MDLREVIYNAADAARTRRRLEYYKQTGKDPDETVRPVLIGHCFENAQELSYELFKRQVPHKVIYGGMIASFVNEGATERAWDIMKNIDLTQYADDNGGYDPSMWDKVPKPQTREDIPSFLQHFWIEIDETETMFWDDVEVSGDERQKIKKHHWHAEIAAEARHRYGEIFVTRGHPENHYIRPKDAVIKPWEWDSRDDWKWNGETLNWTN